MLILHWDTCGFCHQSPNTHRIVPNHSLVPLISLSFYAWHISSNIMVFSPIYVVVNDRILLFLWLPSIPLCICHSRHQLIDTRFLFTSVNNTIIKMGIPPFRWHVDFISLCVSRYEKWIIWHFSFFFSFLLFFLNCHTVSPNSCSSFPSQAPPCHTFSNLSFCLPFW